MNNKELLYEIYDFIKEERAKIEHRKYPRESYDNNVVRMVALSSLKQFDVLFMDRIEESLGFPTPSRNIYKDGDNNE